MPDLPDLGDGQPREAENTVGLPANHPKRLPKDDPRSRNPTMKGIVECCENCRFWAPQPTGGVTFIQRGTPGWCRRFPPRAFQEHTLSGSQDESWFYQSKLPETSESDWCGEYERRRV